MRHRSYTDIVDYDEEPHITRIDVIEQEGGPERTGLLDQYGNRLYRIRDKVKFGFVP